MKASEIRKYLEYVDDKEDFMLIPTNRYRVMREMLHKYAKILLTIKQDIRKGELYYDLYNYR